MSRKFWLQGKETLRELGLQVMEGDEAFYYKHRYGRLQGAVLTQVDDFSLARTDEFIKEKNASEEEVLTVSNVERDRF